jgi:hypothetical protein
MAPMICAMLRIAVFAPEALKVYSPVGLPSRSSTGSACIDRSTISRERSKHHCASSFAFSATFSRPFLILAFFNKRQPCTWAVLGL